MGTSSSPSVSPEVRKQIIERIKKEGIPVPQAAEEHGISKKTIYAWLARGATSPPSWTELSRLKRENEELLKLVGKLTRELDTVKKRLNG